MTKENAIEYLRYLHELEKRYRLDLFGADMRLQIEEIRLKFIKSYNDEKGV